jgi:hypothetical protein
MTAGRTITLRLESDAVLPGIRLLAGWPEGRAGEIEIAGSGPDWIVIRLSANESAILAALEVLDRTQPGCERDSRGSQVIRELLSEGFLTEVLGNRSLL